MLVLVGMGVANDLTLNGLAELKSCDVIYTETYTNPLLKDFIPSLEKLVGRKLIEIKREQVESSFLILEAINKKVGLVVSGDPLIATTHVIFVNECRKRNIPVKIIHNSSISCVAPARAGLQIYRFGKTVTLVNPRENYKPTSSLEGIRENLKRGLHTLVLLDTEPSPMKIDVALKMLSEFNEAIVLSRVCCEDEKISYGTIKNLMNHVKELGAPPFTIIIPAELYMVEKEYLEWFKLNDNF